MQEPSSGENMFVGKTGWRGENEGESVMRSSWSGKRVRSPGPTHWGWGAQALTPPGAVGNRKAGHDQIGLAFNTSHFAYSM